MVRFCDKLLYMIAIILLMHIAFGLTSLGYALLIGISTKKDVTSVTLSSVKKMWYSLVGVTIGGIALSVLTKASFGRTCTALLSFMAIALFAHVYQKNGRRKTGCPYLDQI